MNRRSATVLLTAGVLPSRLAEAQHQVHTAAAANTPYKPRFFEATEFQFVDVAAGMILPADEHSPGAQEAKVAAFLDLVIVNSSAAVRKQWREAIAAFGHGRFLEATDVERRAILERAAAEERNPTSPQGKFFALLKPMVLRAFYTSEIGMRKELGYLGPQALAKFPGCSG